MSVSRSAVASRTFNPCKSSFNFIENSLFFRKISGQYRLPVLYTGSFAVYMEKCADYPANPAQSAVADWLPNWTVTTLPAFSSVPGSLSWVMANTFPEVADVAPATFMIRPASLSAWLA